MPGFNIPLDMQRPELADKFGGTVASIRDLMILFGASDQQLRDSDEQDRILAREPWRRNKLHFQTIKRLEGGGKLGFMRGKVDWSGTRFAKEED